MPQPAPREFVLPLDAGAQVPAFSRLPERLAARVRHDAEAGCLRVRGPLDVLAIWMLRGLRGDDPAWQRSIDRLQDAVGPPESVGASRFPTTQWGLLLADVRDGDDDRWAEFLRVYRTPTAAPLIA
ncbi:MAG: hypothetical protein AB7K09_09665 [Planctomycetota bacterium]